MRLPAFAGVPLQITAFGRKQPASSRPHKDWLFSGAAHTVILAPLAVSGATMTVEGQYWAVRFVTDW
jgi:hypothetical protein